MTGILRVAVGNAQTKSHLSYLIVPPPRFDIIISGQYTSPNYTLLNLTMAHLVDLLHKNDITKLYIINFGIKKRPSFEGRFSVVAFPVGWVTVI